MPPSAGLPTSPTSPRSSASCSGATVSPAHNENFAHFDDPAYNRRLDAAAALSGPARYRADAELDADLIAKAAPIAAVSAWLHRGFFAARIGCQIYQPMSIIDLAALCIKRR